MGMDGSFGSSLIISEPFLMTTHESERVLSSRILGVCVCILSCLPGEPAIRGGGNVVWQEAPFPATNINALNILLSGIVISR